MKHVSQEEFFRRLYAEKRDVHPSIQPGPWPYTSLWKFRREGGVFGKSVCLSSGGSEYFIEAAQLAGEIQ